MEQKWQELLRHDFLAKSQASYFARKKETIEVGEVVVSLDFAENYSFVVQNAIQSHHWSNSQATLHPYVIYYRDNETIKHENYVIISEKVTHDSSSVHLFNFKLVEFLKDKLGVNNIKTIFYFSDGAASQYKNKYNFLNLIYHQSDFNIDAEWNFFATSHGKGACDGVGGTVKRHAYRTSVQRDNDHHIISAKSLFEWAKSFFKNINFGFCSQDEHDSHETRYKSRHDQAITIKNTRQFHFFKSVNKNSLICKSFSEDEKSIINLVFKKEQKKKV